MPATDKRKADPQTHSVRFLLDGEVVSLTDVDPTRTVLQYLREDLRPILGNQDRVFEMCRQLTVVGDRRPLVFEHPVLGSLGVGSSLRAVGPRDDGAENSQQP